MYSTKNKLSCTRDFRDFVWQRMFKASSWTVIHNIHTTSVTATEGSMKEAGDKGGTW